MKSFFDEIKDSCLTTWTTDDDISLSSSSSSDSESDTSIEDASSIASSADHDNNEAAAVDGENADHNIIHFPLQDEDHDEVDNDDDEGDNNVLESRSDALQQQQHHQEEDEAGEHVEIDHEGPAELPRIGAAGNNEEQPRNGEDDHDYEIPNNNVNDNEGGEDGDDHASDAPSRGGELAMGGAAAAVDNQRQIQYNPNVGNILNRRNSMEILHNIEEHERSSSLLFRIARCEALPLIRAEIDWNLLQSDLSTYPATELGDEYGVFLLANILRMDPPCGIVKDILRLYPKSCIDMDPFYAACQYSSDDVVQLLIRRTMRAREKEGIHWSMLALLGDARIRLRHAKMLLQYAPSAVVSPSHGPFGVSPLDRMMSGAFIHGDTKEWVNKLKLALRVAETGTVEVGNDNNDSNNDIDNDDDDDQGEEKSNIIRNHNHNLNKNNNNNKSNQRRTSSFYPFHALLRRLTSTDFMGVEFGALSFVNCLSACVDGESRKNHYNHCSKNAPTASTAGAEAVGTALLRPFHQLNDKGYLPLHSLLAQVCNTNLGIIGERKLVKFLVHANEESVMTRYPSGESVIRLAIKNGWPVYDIISNHCPVEYTEGTKKSSSTSPSPTKKHKTTTKMQHHVDDLFIHDVLSGPYHNERFGICGARQVMKYIVKKFPKSASKPDKYGRYPIHLAIANNWPCHDIIVSAAPHTLEIPNPINGLYPFQMAAAVARKHASNIKSSNNDVNNRYNVKLQYDNIVSRHRLLEQLSISYELLREGPSLLAAASSFQVVLEEDDCKNRRLDEEDRHKAQNRQHNNNTNSGDELPMKRKLYADK